MVQKIPPPPPLGINDQPLNRWLIELQNIINGGGQIDTTAVTQPPGTNNTTIATTAFVLANGSGVPPSTTVPLVDATPGQIGTVLKYARADHQHPTDTSRAPLVSPTFTGTPAAPTPTVGDNTTKLATTAFVLANSGQPGAAVPLADSGAGAAGASPFYSRQDHVHPASGAGGAPIVQAAVNFTVAGGVVTIVKSFNVASVTRVSAGLFIIAFTTPLPDANYYVSGTCDSHQTTNTWPVVDSAATGAQAKTASSCTVSTVISNSAAADPPACYLTFLE